MLAPKKAQCPLSWGLMPTSWHRLTGTQFLRPLSTVETKHDFGSKETDSQRQAPVYARSWELWTFQTGIKRSPSCEEELAILTLPAQSSELGWWA